MFDNHTLTAHAEECAEILTYLEKHPNRTATQIGCWCGMTNQKVSALCRLMARYHLIRIGEGHAFFGKVSTYTRVEATSKNFLKKFAKPLDK